MERFQGKVALVTGASAGIGAATAVALAQNGLKVVGMARRVERVEALKSQLKNAKGEIFAIQGDVSKIEDVTRVFDWIKQKFGTIHVLINNAGIGRNGGITDGNIQDLIDVINTNVVGLVTCTQKALQLMKESSVDDGHIVNINSILGHIVPNLEYTFNVYPASKHGVTAFTESLRQELVNNNSKIKVTSISPGGVATEIRQAMSEVSGVKWEGLNPEYAQKYAKMPRLRSEDISDAILYVLGTPPHVQVHELIIKPVGEAF